MATKLTEEQRNRYIERGGTSCPYCGSADITGGFVEVDAGSAWQPISCEECGEEWKDYFTLTDVLDE